MKKFLFFILLFPLLLPSSFASDQEIADQIQGLRSDLQNQEVNEMQRRTQERINHELGESLDRLTGRLIAKEKLKEQQAEAESDKHDREMNRQAIEQDEKQEKAKEESEKKRDELFEEYITNENPSPEAIAEKERRREEDRQYVIGVYDLPSDIPYELANKIMVERRGLAYPEKERTNDKIKTRVHKIINDYKKSRGLPTSDEDYETEDMLKTAMHGEMMLLAVNFITPITPEEFKEKVEKKKEEEFFSLKKYGLITTKEQEQSLRRWADDYINKTKLKDVKAEIIQNYNNRYK